MQEILRDDALKVQMRHKIQNRIMNLVVIYLLSSLLLYFIGPFQWVTKRLLLFCVYNILYIFSFYFGFRAGTFSKSAIRIQWTENHHRKLMRYLVPLTAANCLITLINMIRRFGMSGFNLSLFFSRIMLGFSNSGQGYFEAITALEGMRGADLLGGSLFTLINLIWQFWDFNILLLDIYYFKRGSLLHKILSIISISEIIIYYLSIGTNIGIFRILIAISVIFLMKTLKLEVEKGVSRESYGKSKKRKRKTRILIIISVCMVVFYFIKTMEGRAGGVYIWRFDTYNVGGIYLNRDSILFKIFPQFFYMPIIMISSYLTQGYYGFARSLELPWKPTYGLGSSMGVVDMLTRYGIDIDSLTYQKRVEEMFHWNSRNQWASMYTWIANDVGFFGVAVVMLIIGYFFSIVIRDCLQSENPYAYCLAVFFFIMVFFIPCNNQIVQTTYMLFALLYAVFHWLTSTRIKLKL